MVALTSTAPQHIWHLPAKATPILRAGFASEGGVIGAALATREE
jgi:hypothetical protein